MKSSQASAPSSFSGYQKLVIGILSFLQFTVILDFMILSPLGAILMPELNMTTAQFGLVVSAYAFSAGLSGFLAAGFADRYDRKKLLLFFYVGFVLGTFLCGIAPNYEYLLAARMVTGLFGGVIGSISFAIVTDIFPLEMRGRVMGYLQTAFAASQVMGIPIGLYFSNLWGWHAPFMMIVAVSTAVGVVIFMKLKPVNAHLEVKNSRNPMQHLFHTISNSRYIQGFAATALLSTGGFMLMPFGSAFSVNNLGISLENLPFLYMATGVCSMIAGPFLGKLTDRIGKFNMFVFGSVLTVGTVLYYTRLGVTPMGIVILISVIMWIGISSRMISSSALMSALPGPADRGSFMAVSASIQQVAGGIASAIAGMIVVQTASGKIEHFEEVGYLVAVTAVMTIVMLFFINRYIQNRPPSPATPV